jgi:hypothetical protein
MPQRVLARNGDVSAFCLGFGLFSAGAVLYHLLHWGTLVYPQPASGIVAVAWALTQSVFMVAMLLVFWTFSNYPFRHVLVILLAADVARRRWSELQGSDWEYGFTTIGIELCWIVAMCLLYYAPQTPPPPPEPKLANTT